MKPLLSLCCALTCCLLLAPVCLAQEQAQPPLKLEQAIELALANYPALRIARAQKLAAEANIELSRTSLLPRAELLAQENRASRNNVFGLLLPQSTLPSISGPVLNNTSQTSAWGSAAGLLVAWEPFDFGLRQAQIDLAKAQTKQAGASENVTKLDVTFAAAEAFLAALAHEQAVRAAQANVDRLETFGKAVYALVNNQLRPGVEASRAEVELVAAKNQLIQLQQNAELARIALADAIGQPGTIARLDPGPLLEYTPNAPALPAVNTFATHPLLLAQSATIDVVKARQTTLDKSFFPRFNWQTAVFGRGTGARLDGTFREARGFYPDTFNYATGFTVTFTVSDWFGLKAKRRVERFNLQAEEARLAQVTNTLKTQEARARALIEAAYKLAENTPAQVNAASETLTRSKVRYEYGLTTITEVAEAQRLLAQAEIDEAVARLGVWRAYLVAAKLQGELKPFLDQMTSVSAERK
ncbi:MAG: TolC family protein [Acidobacteria bacterium]|nr:TolC family protein [Acidobacteriota bacterium]